MAAESTVEVVMPAMGDSVSEGTVLEWHKREGGQVSEAETLVEISTDKVDAEVPAPAAGTVVKVHAAEGDTVTVGALLAEIAPGDPGEGSAGDGAGGGGTASAAPPAARQAPEEAAAPAEAAPAPAGEAVEITMPAMGESVSEGVILEWAKQPGDPVEADETIVEISTDKVDAEVPAPAAGVMGEILAQPGDTVTVGQLIARMTSGGEAASRAPQATQAPVEVERQREEAPADGVSISPVARRVAAAEGIDLGKVHGTGPGGRITKSEVLGATNGAAAPSPNGNAQLIKGASAMHARYMDESRSTPPATSSRTIPVPTLDARRKELKNAGHKVSFSHLIAYAIARAATEQMPVMAHHFADVDGKPHRVDDGAVNLGIAVDVERKDGGRTLMVPVIRDAGRLSFAGFLDAFNDL